ncbi:MAG: lysoplasmalogenase [Flavobacteriales bacterium]|nr:lysoplasmalogenase [Flavobacteriales bacterium]
MRPWFLFIYIALLVITVISAIDPGLTQLHNWSKPSLMISLFACIALNWKQGKARLYVPLILAVTFSLIGDILLLPELGSTYFVAGLLSFLCAHICYIVLFLKVPHRPLEVPFIRRNPWLIFLAIVFGIWMFTKIKSGAGDIAWAVLIYTLVILTMFLAAFNREGAVGKKSFVLVALGAFLFTISDSILAWNKFNEPVVMASTIILSTYGLAQLMIVRGVLLQE